MIDKNASQDSKAHLILASASPRRRFLLDSIGLKFQVIPSGIDEMSINGESPEEQVRRLAEAKAMDVAASNQGLWTLGADTIVVIDGEILGKPTDPRNAEEMLARLSGRVHEVFTGYAILQASPGLDRRVSHVRSEVRIRRLSPDEISGYVATNEPMDKAGSYAIQGIGSAIVEEVYGSYTNVVGLPLCEVSRDLKEMGVFDFLDRDGKR